MATVRAALRRGSEGYERARAGTLWNALVPERFPDVIVRPGYIALYGGSPEPAGDGESVTWATERMREMEPLSSGIQPWEPSP
jgi:hypothetical protein